MSDEGGGGHGGGGDERWLVSYADFMTLLMVFFVIMYSIAQIDVKKYQLVAESLRRAFGGDASVVVDPAISQSGVSGGDAEPAPVNLEDFPPRAPDTLDVATDIGATLSSAGLSSEVNVNNNAEGVLISISEQLLFQPGSAEIQPSAKAVLDKLAIMLQTIPNDVRVVAHTDPTPPADPAYPTNWHLSTARAINIVRYLIEFGGIAPERLSAAGQAEYHPLFPNDSPEHMAFNRRADIVVVYPLDQQQVSVGVITPIQIPGLP
jgi:chemotaxis protein MotB